MTQSTEFGLIRHLNRVSGGPGVVLGIGDDAALLRPSRGALLVACVDTLVEGVHFPRGTRWSDLGWKALAVNLSDMAAMGAVARWATLALTLPRGDSAAFLGIVRGLRQLARQHAVSLVGGDTTRGPLALTVQVLGEVPPKRALRRAGAVPGDGLWVSGTLGDAAAGLALRQGRLTARSAQSAVSLHRRLERPSPRLALGLALRGLASACIDVSDGLAQDLRHMLRASRVGGEIDVDALPQSAALRRAQPDAEQRRRWALNGGDDYELCFAVPARFEPRMVDLSRRLRLPLTRFGVVSQRLGLRLSDRCGNPVHVPLAGHDHFV